METVFSLLIGYTLGCLHPSALIGFIKKRDVRREGTHNLGATNVTFVFGKLLGLLVMLFDIGKAAGASLLAAYLFPTLSVAGLLAGCGAILGHIFPFYLGFRGGKGLAAFAGTVLAYNPRLFLLLLFLGVGLMLAVNYSVALPYSAAILFCLLATWESRSFTVFCVTGIASCIILISHIGNLRRAIKGEDIRVRDAVRRVFAKKEKEKEQI